MLQPTHLTVGKYSKLFDIKLRGFIFCLLKCLSTGQIECTLEKLKTEYVCTWLFEIMKTHYQVFVSCLLPHPADYVRIGGHW